MKDCIHPHRKNPDVEKNPNVQQDLTNIYFFELFFKIILKAQTLHKTKLFFPVQARTLSKTKHHNCGLKGREILNKIEF